MTRHASGQVIERRTKRGAVFALRFRVGGSRRYETLGTSEDGWTRRARRGRARATSWADDPSGASWQPREAHGAGWPELMSPTFHEFASEWLKAQACRRSARRTRGATIAWALQLHLLPHFAALAARREISVEEVDRYKRGKARDGALSPAVVNKTLTRLAQILEDAVEYGHIERNPAEAAGDGSRSTSRRPIYIDTASHIRGPASEAASSIDVGRPSARTSGRRALVRDARSSPGLRVTRGLSRSAGATSTSESGRITVRASKTAAGVRQGRHAADPARRAARLQAGRRRPRRPRYSPTAAARLRDKDNVARRVISAGDREGRRAARRPRRGPACPKASPPTSCATPSRSLLAACGEDPATSCPSSATRTRSFTLRVYTHLMSRRDGERDRLQGPCRGC